MSGKSFLLERYLLDKKSHCFSRCLNVVCSKVASKKN